MEKNILNPHGGDIYKASEIYGFRKENFIDFSANINPLGVPVKLKENIISNINNLVNYPDPDCIALGFEISRFLDIPKESLIIGNGASEVISLLFDVLRPEKVLIPAPTFSEYGKAAAICGTQIKNFELKEQDNYRLNIDDLIVEMAAGVDAVVLCNPNNPTSTLIAKSDLLCLIGYAKEKGISVIIDEAFIELTEGANTNSVVHYIKEFSNLFIVRAFTKIFAIPGLRLGYGIGESQAIKKMWERKLPWSVNSFACCFGEFLCQADEYLLKTSTWISEEKEWFYNELKQIQKLKVFKPETNFVLIKLLDSTLTSGMLKDILASRGILIRDASNFMFLNNKFFRLAIKDRESNIKILKELKIALKVN